MMEILAIIPARGGSKGIPMKNIQKLAGKPLIEYTISAAKKSKKLNRILVSTDNEKIARISRSLGAEVPFMRPKKLARDNSTGFDVIKYILKSLSSQGYVPNIIVILQPTSPLRTTSMIDRSIEILKNSNATSILSVSKVKFHPYSSFWHNGKYLKPFRQDFENNSLRQKKPDLYHPTGAIYTFWMETIKKYDSIYGPRIKPMIVPHEVNVDIDSPFDLFISEMKILHWNDYEKNFYRHSTS
ncbi:MAG: acylneuraminate cytidylyltransferase family protein [Patescibacteria group bacterium]|nr:acylneuraminate cytidylyltransferase family protein [Patescibacteria group bacterium]